MRAWATMVTPYADTDQGFEMIPSVDTQVVIAFEAGELRRPYIVGAAWNGREVLPQKPAQANNIRVIKTRSGSRLEFDDSEGTAKVTLSMKNGHELVMDNSNREVRLRHNSGSIISFDEKGNITITAKAGVTINAPTGLAVNAPSSLFSGSVTCQPLTATSVTSPLYSQGAGNFW